MKESIHILMINSDPVERSLYRAILEKGLDNLDLEEATNDVETRQLLDVKEYDLILIDSELECGSGLEVVKNIRARKLETPIILLADTDSENAVIETIKAGADDYISKSVKHIARLPARIARVTERSTTKQKIKRFQTNERTEPFIGIFESSPLSVLICDNDGRVLQSNPAILDILGYEEQDLKNINLVDLVHHEDVEVSLNSLKKIFSCEMESFQVEQRYRHKQGYFVWGDVSISLVRDIFRESQHAIIQFKDITEQKQANLSFLKQTELTRLLGNIAVTSNESSSVDEALTKCLDAVCRYTGWPVGHAYLVSGEENNKLVTTKTRYAGENGDTDLLRQFSDSIRKAAAYGLPGRVLRTKRPTWVSDFNTSENFVNKEIIHQYGIEAGFAFPVLLGNEVVAVIEFFCGQVTEPDFELLEVMVHIGTQLGRVVERERAKASLKLSEDKFATAFRSSPDAIAIISAEEGIFVEINETFLILHGFSRHEVIGHKVSDLKLWVDEKQLDELIENLYKHGAVRGMEADFRDSAGDVINCHISAESIDISGQSHILVIARDITERKRAERELHRYKHIVSSSTDMMAFVDTSLVYRAVNTRYMQAMAKDWGDVVGHTLDEVLKSDEGLGKEQFHDIKQYVERVLAGEVLIFQRWATLPGLGECYLDISYSPHRDSDGTITGFVMRGHDMTEQKRSEQLLRSYFDAGFVGMSIIAPNKRWLQANDAMSDVLGYTGEELRNMTILDITHSEETPESEKLFNSVLDGEIDGYSMDKRVVKKNGNVIHVSVSTECIRKEDGSVDYLVAFMKDITKRKEAEQELRESEARVLDAQRIAHLGFWEVDVKTDDIILSDEVLTICAIEPSSFDNTHASFLESIHPEDRERVMEAKEMALRGEIPFNLEYRILRPNDEIRYVYGRAEVIRDKHDEPSRMVGTIHDITVRKQVELALYRSNRALRVLNECTHTIVHASSGQEMINDVCRIIVNTGGYLFAWVGYAQSDDRKTVYPVSSAGYEAGYLDNDFSWNENSKRFDPVSDVIMTAKPFIVNNMTDSSEYGGLRNAALERGFRSEIALPLNVGHKAFGALMIYASEPDAFDAEEEKLLTSLADDLAFGIISLHMRTEHERAERSLQDSENKYRLLYDENPAMFFTVDTRGIILSVNKFGAEELGYTVAELIGMSIFDLSYQSYKEYSQEHLKTWLENPDQVHHWEQQKVRKNGTVLWVKETVRVITGIDDEKNIFIVCEDITETRELSEKLSYQATHDSLTGLINRGEFEQRLQKMLVSTQQNESQHALCYMDLDQFKIINDTSGHIAGDELLRQLGLLLQSQIRQRDTVARLGGDEFGILMEHCPLHRAEYVAKKIMSAISDFQFIWEDKIFKIGVSIGLVPIDKTSGNMTAVLKNGDTACYAAKDNGRNCIHIYGEGDADFVQKHGEIRWVTRIQEALEKDRFRLYFQVIAATDKNQSDTDHFEVLIRMQTPEGKLMTPDTFMPAAEYFNLSPRIDRWVINELFELSRILHTQGKLLPYFSVNLSGHSLGDKELLDFILHSFSNGYLPPQNICFEITETVAIANLTSAMRFINTLREQGCSFALDDFGSGLSSFAYLKNLQVDYLKIDGIFIRDLMDSPINQSIVKSMHEIGKTLGKKTVAEYVENQEILELLREIGVDYVQGSFIGKECSFEEIKFVDNGNIVEFSKRS